MEKRPEKINHHDNRRKLFYGSNTISVISVLMSPSEKKSLCHQIDEDADAVVVACIFNGAAMKKTVSPYHLIVAGEEEKINLQN